MKMKKNFFVKSIQPSVNKAIKNKIISKEIVVAVNKDIKPMKQFKSKER